MKDLLTQAPILQYPDFSKPFNLTCHTSDYAIGCLLSQISIRKDLPIVFVSHTLKKAEINYNTTEKELTRTCVGNKCLPFLFVRITVQHNHRSSLFVMVVQFKTSWLQTHTLVPEAGRLPVCSLFLKLELSIPMQMPSAKFAKSLPGHNRPII